MQPSSWDYWFLLRITPPPDRCSAAGRPRSALCFSRCVLVKWAERGPYLLISLRHFMYYGNTMRTSSGCTSTEGQFEFSIGGSILIGRRLLNLEVWLNESGSFWKSLDELFVWLSRNYRFIRFIIISIGSMVVMKAAKKLLLTTLSYNYPTRTSFTKSTWIVNPVSKKRRTFCTGKASRPAPSSPYSSCAGKHRKQFRMKIVFLIFRIFSVKFSPSRRWWKHMRWVRYKIYHKHTSACVSVHR